MSDTGKVASPTEAAPKFSERELQLLGWAMQSLKSGPPEIDYEKLAAFAGMSNPRSASNAWAKLKGKLMSADGAAAAATPKKAGGKKKAIGEATPKKTPASRKRAAKQQDVDGEASPTKKGRSKKSPDDEAAILKNEAEDSPEPASSTEGPVKAEASGVEESAEEEF